MKVGYARTKTRKNLYPWSIDTAELCLQGEVGTSNRTNDEWPGEQVQSLKSTTVVQGAQHRQASTGRADQSAARTGEGFRSAGARMRSQRNRTPFRYDNS